MPEVVLTVEQGLFVLLVGGIVLVLLSIGIGWWYWSLTNAGRNQTRGHELGFW